MPDTSALFDRVNPLAVQYTQERGAELVTGIDEATRNEMAGIITSGLDDNIGMDAIAENIKAAYSFSNYRSNLIAKTEIAKANQNGVLIGMKSAKDIGLKITKVWLPDAIACEICLDNGDAGAIDIDDVFPSGDDAPPAHPNCRCTIASEIEEDEPEEDTQDDTE